MTLDSIDRLLELLDLQTRIEVYCHLQAPFHMVHEPDTPGTAWFHLLLEGSCTIATGGHPPALLLDPRSRTATEVRSDE